VTGLISQATDGDPTTIEPNLLMKEFARGGVIGGVRDVLDQMKKDGISTKTTFTYNQLILAHGRAKDFTRAMEYYGRMKKPDTDTPPDVETLNCILDACRVNEKFDEAIQSLEEMTKPKATWPVTPNLQTEITMIKIYGQAAEITKAFSAVDKLLSDSTL